jgi:hypothetical protein
MLIISSSPVSWRLRLPTQLAPQPIAPRAAAFAKATAGQARNPDMLLDGSASGQADSQITSF